MSSTQPQAPIEAQPTARVILPFIDTGPLTDIKLGLLLLPIWWWLGVEQFIWPLVFALAAAKVLYLQRWRLLVAPSLRWFALFLIAVLISGFFIDEPSRQMTYVRNLGAFSAGFLVLLVLTNRARSWKEIDKLLNVVLFVMVLMGIIGLLAAADIWRPALQSVIGRFLPASITATSYGQSIAIRELGQSSWFSGFGEYYRVSSFFLFSNHYSSALIYTLPLFFMRLGQTKGAKRVLVGLAIVMLLINLVYTTGRVASLSLLVSALYFSLFHSLYRRTIRGLLALAMTLAILIILFTAYLEMTSSGQDEGIFAQTTEAIEFFALARGSGSFTNRSGVYAATLTGFLERPLFGWGTERDVEGLNIPAGSHSEYLAALYRQGLLGFIAMVGLLISVWRTTRPPTAANSRNPAGTFLRYGRWMFVASLVNSLMTDPSVDSTTFVILWTLLGLLVATALLTHRSQREYAVPSH